MTKSTRIVDVVEMTREEQTELWNMTKEERLDKLGICDWNLYDGNNEIRLVGEDFWRPICTI